MRLRCFLRVNDISTSCMRLRLAVFNRIADAKPAKTRTEWRPAFAADKEGGEHYHCLLMAHGSFPAVPAPGNVCCICRVLGLVRFLGPPRSQELIVQLLLRFHDTGAWDNITLCAFSKPSVFSLSVKKSFLPLRSCRHRHLIDSIRVWDTTQPCISPF